VTLYSDWYAKISNFYPEHYPVPVLATAIHQTCWALFAANFGHEGIATTEHDASFGRHSIAYRGHVDSRLLERTSDRLASILIWMACALVLTSLFAPLRLLGYDGRMDDKPDATEPEPDEPAKPWTYAYRVRRRRQLMFWLMVALFAIALAVTLIQGPEKWIGGATF
jgi:uncharacterized membrane protein YtjA (UPF0391 family)